MPVRGCHRQPCQHPGGHRRPRCGGEALSRGDRPSLRDRGGTQQPGQAVAVASPVAGGRGLLRGSPARGSPPCPGAQQPRQRAPGQAGSGRPSPLSGGPASPSRSAGGLQQPPARHQLRPAALDGRDLFAHREFSARFERPSSASASVPPGPRRPGRLRIGYVSGTSGACRCRLRRAALRASRPHPVRGDRLLQRIRGG